jgi:hypothetical protein
MSGRRTIRVGAGGIMLPNHSPLVIAEQFGTLETLYPGRIDLGLGRAPGTDQLTVRALRRPPSSAEHFREDVRELQALLGPLQPGQTVQAVPGTGLKVPIWILGSSLFGAQLAASYGLPYAFASHFAPDALMQDGATYVITRYRNPAVNIRTQFLRILAKAGIEPWPKLFQNLRSSRQTELTESWPAHVVCAWIGNSEVVARDHYLQITDEHFAKAAEAASETGGAESGAASARKASQDVAPCSGSDSTNATSAGACDSVRDDATQREEEQMGDTGLEPVTSRV